MGLEACRQIDQLRVLRGFLCALADGHVRQARPADPEIEREGERDGRGGKQGGRQRAHARPRQRPQHQQGRRRGQRADGEPEPEAPGHSRRRK